ncbi:MAG TPA: hypothetical protein PKD09_07765 [Aggregatilinea sp.]|jgi:hypothetical protein|uniref:hypothetical protein n=1 Tax=Aggregatilinea sp. TaxID=2806333 RepID=UPI002C29F2B1|nr:hypothetical protein [Aggregatilinea sp.]HML21526.1 hypothetical protein [Aggregatilinea sp.]
MSKRFGLVLVALLIVPMLLTACSTESRDVAEDYMNALLKGDSAAAQKYACDSFQDQTASLAEMYSVQNIHNKDLKFDIGKGNNQEEIIVTGSYLVGPENDADEVELAQKVHNEETNEDLDTRIVLWMADEDGWCVSDKSDFGDGVEMTAAPVESEPMATEEPAADATQAAQ